MIRSPNDMDNPEMDEPDIGVAKHNPQLWDDGHVDGCTKHIDLQLRCTCEGARGWGIFNGPGWDMPDGWYQIQRDDEVRPRRYADDETAALAHFDKVLWFNELNGDICTIASLCESADEGWRVFGYGPKTDEAALAVEQFNADVAAALSSGGED